MLRYLHKYTNTTNWSGANAEPPWTPLVNKLLGEIARAEQSGRPIKRLSLTLAEIEQLRKEMGVYFAYPPIPGTQIGHLFGIPLFLEDNLISAAQRLANDERTS